MSYRTVDVAVEGGTLRAGIRGESGPVVLCARGLTANHVSFAPLVDAFGSGVRVLTPDPCEQRAEVVLGHSMGGFADLVGDTLRFRASVREGAILGDTRSQLVEDDVPRVLEKLSQERP